MTKDELHFLSGEHDHQRCLATALQRAEAICQQTKQRLTPLRRQVFSLVWSQHKPIGAYEILDQLKAAGRAAPPTVYRALDFLLEVGLVHRISSLNAYVGCIQPQHQHVGQFLICEQCRSFAELDSAKVNQAIDQCARDKGFIAHQYTVEILGICPRCQQSKEERA